METSTTEKKNEEGDKKLQDEGVDIFSGKDIIAEVVFEQNEEASLMANEGKAAF